MPYVITDLLDLLGFILHEQVLAFSWVTSYHTSAHEQVQYSHPILCTIVLC